MNFAGSLAMIRRHPLLFVILVTIIASLFVIWLWVAPGTIPRWMVTVLPTPLYVRTPCWVGTLPGHRPNCGSVFVRGDRTSHEPWLVRLPVVRFVATTDKVEGDVPLLYFQGGPGTIFFENKELNTEVWRSFFQERVFVQHRTVIVVGYRGFGRARPSFECQELAGAQGRPDFGRALGARLSKCIATAPVSADQWVDFSTPAIVEDIEDIRKVLQIRKWDIVAESYGTRIFFDLVRKHAKTIRSAALAGVLPPQAGSFGAGWSNRVFDAVNAILDGCGHLFRCGASPDELRRLLKSTLSWLRRRTVTFERIEDRPTPRFVKVGINDREFVRMLFYFMQYSDTLAIIPELLQDMDHADTTELENAYGGYRAIQQIGAHSGEAGHRIRSKPISESGSSRSPVGAKRRGRLMIPISDRLGWILPSSFASILL